ncbi:MAG TPA: DNA primase [Candidatus Limiplasma merdipullorum]|nr:DNA primase [Candidatus Limiplasma merdipullorum]
MKQRMAGRYPPQWLDELRARADIVKVIGSYVTLKKNGHRYVGLCPFHNETAPSFSVDEQKQVYHCFGCKAGGSVIQFVMDIERLSFPEAVAFLADQLHMPLPEMQNDPAYEKRRTLKERIYLANRTAARMYHQLLWQPESSAILHYLQQRGLSDAVIRRFGIGAAPPSAQVGHRLMEEGFTEEELVQAGLMLRREGRTFDMFRNRAMFPIIDTYGNVLGFGGRAMGDAMPKYLNTSDTPAFNKRYTVFAANLLRKARGLTRVILVEGYMDVVALSQFGVEGVAATLGTALTPEQARLLHRFAPEVYIAYDGDRAGQKAILRGLEVLEGENVPVRVLDFPGGLDPDEFIRQEGLEAFQALKPISAVTYRMRREKERHDVSTEEGRIEYAKACAAILRGVKEPVELENHLRHLSVETGFSKEVLMQQIGAAPPPKVVTAAKREGFRQKAREVSQVDWTARTLLAVLATGRLPKDSVSPEEFEDPLLRSLCEGLLAGESAASLMERQTDDQGRAAVGDILSLNTDLDDDGLMRMAQDCLKKMRKQRLEKALDLIQQRLPTLAGEERERETQRAFALTQQLLDLK